MLGDWLLTTSTIDLDLLIDELFYNVCLMYLLNYFVLVEDLCRNFKLAKSFLICSLCFLPLNRWNCRLWCRCWRFISFFPFSMIAFCFYTINLLSLLRVSAFLTLLFIFGIFLVPFSAVQTTWSSFFFDSFPFFILTQTFFFFYLVFVSSFSQLKFLPFLTSGKPFFLVPQLVG